MLPIVTPARDEPDVIGGPFGEAAYTKNDKASAAEMPTVPLRVGDRLLFASIELHLPGRHNQQSHGNKAHRPASQNVPGKTGLARLASLALAHSMFEKGMAIKKADEAAVAKKQAALTKKWKGKPAPKAPQKPAPPHKDPARHFDGWKAKVSDRYDQLGTGKKIESSYNYSYVTTAIEKQGTPEGDAAIDLLRDKKYIDGALQKEYYDAVKAAKAAPGNAEKDPDYLKALKAYKGATTRHKRYLAQWQEVNGVTGNLNGMDGAVRHQSATEGKAWADEHFPRPSDAAVHALSTYTGSEYSNWNAALRKAEGKLPDGSWAKYTKDADSGMSAFPEDVVVHRGTGFGEFAWPEGTPQPPKGTYDVNAADLTKLIGSVQVQRGYMSTSVGDKAAFGSKKVQMVVRVPAGHKGAWVDSFSQHQGENEMLLQRNTELFIHDAYIKNGQWIVEAEVLPEGVTAAQMAGHPPMPLTKSTT